LEVVRTDEPTPWGWRPETCAYHEQWQFVALSDKGASLEEE
jgi:hypothetical protein